MSKGSIETRVERLESQVNGEGLEGDLYDWEGNQVTDARIVKWPTEQARGIAIVDGSRREIAATTNLLTILKAGRARREAGEEVHMGTDEERAEKRISGTVIPTERW